MKRANDIVTSLLGVLLIIAAVLKGWQLLTEPAANNSIWTYRPFLILPVQFELALSLVRYGNNELQICFERGCSNALKCPLLSSRLGGA